MKLGADLAPEAKESILVVLRRNGDIFAWGPKDIPGVARETIEHRLAIKAEARPKKQKLHRMSTDRLEVAKAEIAKLSSVKSSTPNGWPTRSSYE